MKKSAIIMLAAILTLAFGGAASAHVTVQPKQVPANSYQVFTLRVPTEKEAATTAIKVEIPDGVDVSRFEPKPDWTYELDKNADGKITVVTWKTSGSGLSSTEFGQFDFQGKVAEDAKELVWRAHQTYADGTVVDWTGTPEADKPASVTAVTAAAGGDGHGSGAAAEASSAPATGGSGRDMLTLSLAIAGLAAGVLALIVSLVRKPKA